MKVRRTISPHEQFRRRAGYSVTGLAKALDYSHSYVSQVEGGSLPPSEEYRRRFCELLGVPEDMVFDGEDAA